MHQYHRHQQRGVAAGAAALVRPDPVDRTRGEQRGEISDCRRTGPELEVPPGRQMEVADRRARVRQLHDAGGRPGRGVHAQGERDLEVGGHQEMAAKSAARADVPAPFRNRIRPASNEESPGV